MNQAISINKSHKFNFTNDRFVDLFKTSENTCEARTSTGLSKRKDSEVGPKLLPSISSDCGAAALLH